MDLSALESKFRTLAGDHGQPPFWSSEDVRGWLNEGEREAAERARMLHDRTTDACCLVTLLPGVREYRLHPSVFDVEAVQLWRPGNVTRHWAVERDDYGHMAWGAEYRAHRLGWADRFYLMGNAKGDGTAGPILVLDREPTEVGGTLRLSVYRYPLDTLDVPVDEPEIPERYQIGLVYWALSKAYLVRDVELFSPAEATRFETMFTDLIGARQDANVMRKQRRHSAPKVRPNRF